MKKLFMTLVCALAVACAPLDTAASVGGLPPAGAVADKTVLDEKTGIAVEAMYEAVTRAGTLAFKSKLIAPSTNPAVQRDDFCVLVVSGSFTPTDTGSKLTALECRLRQARDLTRAAYDATNAESYDTAAREAIRIGKEILALIQGN